MKSWIKESATSLTALVFVTVGTSGVLLYFHWFEAEVKRMHEMLGLAFVAAALMHVYSHWHGMKRYFRKTLFLQYGVAVIAAALFFIVPAIGQGPNPKRLIIEKTMDAPLDVALRLLGGDVQKAENRLGREGIITVGATTLAEVARQNGVSAFALVSMLADQGGEEGEK